VLDDTIRGPVGLVGSGEFTPAMHEIDGRLLDQAEEAGFERAVAVVPTAAAPDGDAVVRRWLTMAREHFGALDAEVLPIDVRERIDATELRHCAEVAEAGFVYFSGGKPEHLVDVLRGSPLWDAVLERWRLGAPLVGCSAGAMALAAGWPPFIRSAGPWGEGFGVVPRTAVVPHFDRVRLFRLGRLAPLGRHAPVGWRLVGVDEDTALVHSGTGQGDGWSVSGAGGAWEVDAEGARPLEPARLPAPR
jgi:cyanophycinase